MDTKTIIILVVIGIVGTLAIVLSVNTVNNVNSVIEQAYGQIETPFANCVMMKLEDLFVQLKTDEDCNAQQFSEAVTYYKAHGFPHESSYMDLFDKKLIQLDTQLG